MQKIYMTWFDVYNIHICESTGVTIGALFIWKLGFLAPYVLHKNRAHLLPFFHGVIYDFNLWC